MASSGFYASIKQFEVYIARYAAITFNTPSDLGILHSEITQGASFQLHVG